MNLFTRLHKRLLRYPDAPYGIRLLFLLLVPVSMLYGFLSWVRNCAYDRGWLSSYRSRIQVMSVGNLAAGGTGKTPTVDFLVRELLRQGRSPAVVSRGYRGTYRGRAGYVQKNGHLLMTVQEAGDEPYLLARRNPRSAVMVARRRVDAIRILERDQQADVVILDDGFQHRALKRDLDIVLLDARAPFGNGWPLPAGALREWPDALKRADVLVVTRGRTQSDLRWTGLPVFQSLHRQSQTAVSLNGEEVPLAELQGLRLAAFAGIASPESFFSALEEQGITLVHKIIYPDHITYEHRQLCTLINLCSDVDALVTTEKDAVKLKDDLFPCPCYQVAMNFEMEEQNRFWNTIENRLRK